jgi:hypothetical protein
MANPYRSPTDLPTPTAQRPLSPGARIAIVLVIWLVCPFVSVLSFYLHCGSLPQGIPEWVAYPLLAFPIMLPGSFGLIMKGLFGWLPAGFAMVPAALGFIAFWPLYVTFLVLALRTGRRRHFASLAVLSLLGSIYWHYLSVALSGV